MKKIKHTEMIPEGLEKMSRELPFKVADHYFEDFQSRLKTRMETEGSSLSEKRRTIVRYLKPVIGIAAAIALVFLLVFYPEQMVTKMIAGAEQLSEEENLINLIEHVDDHTFFNLLENDPQDVNLEGQELEAFIATNYSDLDIYLETQK